MVDFRFNVTHLPGSRNTTCPLSHRGFTDGDGPAASMCDADSARESQQELFLRLGRDASAPAMLAAVRRPRPVAGHRVIVVSSRWQVRRCLWGSGRR